MELQFFTDISGVLDLIHDRWFALEEVNFDRNKQEVTFYLGETRRAPFRNKLLRIMGVSDVHVSDDAHIGIYDLCDIVPSYDKNKITITSGFPVEIILSVKQCAQIYVLQVAEKTVSGTIL